MDENYSEETWYVEQWLLVSPEALKAYLEIVRN